MISWFCPTCQQAISVKNSKWTQIEYCYNCQAYCHAEWRYWS